VQCQHEAGHNNQACYDSSKKHSEQAMDERTVEM
jgi:hypothetical protein